IVGLKVRDIYEVPAAAILLPAHAELERLVGTIHENRFKPMLDQQWAYLVYGGLWYEPLRLHLDAYMDSVNERVTGEIGLKLYKRRRFGGTVVTKRKAALAAGAAAAGSAAVTGRRAVRT